MRSDTFSERPVAFIGRSLRRSLWAGAAIGGVFFVGFTGWAAWAPLSGAAVAPAVISPDGSRRTVQHLEGGIVQELFVREGSQVEPGQPLLVLESSAARANRDVLQKELRLAIIKRWRLMAERDSAPELAMPTDERLGDLSDPDVLAFIDSQRRLFVSRRDAREQKKKILDQRKNQLEEEIASLKEQIASQTTQIGLLREEAKGVAPLVAQGYERRPRLLGLQRAEAEILGARSASQGAAAKAAQSIIETTVQIASIDAEHAEDVQTQLVENEGSLAATSDKLRAAKDVVDRSVVLAPLAGTIVQLRVHTLGGIVAAGQAILDIVPSDEELLFDARISPNDIDEVRQDLPARVVLTGYKQRNMPQLEGRVREVSADRIVDAQTGQAYYLARIELPAERVREVAPMVSLKPGMPAEVMVMTGERTLLDYLLDPLLSSFRKTFRES